MWSYSTDCKHVILKGNSKRQLSTHCRAVADGRFVDRTEILMNSRRKSGESTHQHLVGKNHWKEHQSAPRNTQCQHTECWTADLRGEAVKAVASHGRKGWERGPRRESNMAVFISTILCVAASQASSGVCRTRLSFNRYLTHRLRSCSDHKAVHVPAGVISTSRWLRMQSLKHYTKMG